MTNPVYVNPQDDLDALFDQQAGGQQAASFAWGKPPVIGTVITGTVVDTFRTVVRDAATKEPKPDKNGTLQPQVNITLQTDLRNWDRTVKVPLAEDGVTEKPASEDDGKRRVYAKFRLLQAIAMAVREAGERGAPKPGGRLAIRLKNLENVGKPNPLPDYEAKYAPPAPQTSADDAFNQAAEQPAQQPAQQAPAAPAVAATPPAPTPQPAAAPATAGQDPWQAAGVGVPDNW